MQTRLLASAPALKEALCAATPLDRASLRFQEQMSHLRADVGVRWRFESTTHMWIPPLPAGLL